jgi:hypothetical protein
LGFFYLLVAAFLFLGSFAYSSTLKMEAAPSPETSVDFTGLHRVASQKIVIFTYHPCFF